MKLTVADVLVSCGIESKAKAKELLRNNAVSINYAENKHSVFCTLNDKDPIELLINAAKLKLWLRIGKRFLERLELCEADSNT